MCVRYTLHRPDAALTTVARALLRKPETPPWAEPRYNVTLTHLVPAFAGFNEPSLLRMRWGFPGVGNAGVLPNAKGETARQLRSFREAAEQRRCLVPANGFYEWQTRGGQKWPHLFGLADDEPFALAGLWAPGADADDPPSFCLLTTVPNDKVAVVHNRMPLLLTGSDCRAWLKPGALDDAAWASFLKPFPAERMTVRAVSRFVSSTRNEGPACHDAVDTAGEQTELF